MEEKKSELKKGDKVKLYDCSEADDYKDMIFTVFSPPWKLGSGRWVCRISSAGKDFPGGFACNKLIKIEEE